MSGSLFSLTWALTSFTEPRHLFSAPLLSHPSDFLVLVRHLSIHVGKYTKPEKGNLKKPFSKVHQTLIEAFSGLEL